MASSRIKGITIEIDGNTTRLTDALKKVDKQVRETQSSLRDINKLLKLDPGNTDLLAQKQKALSDAIDATKEKLQQEQDALKQLQEGPQTEDTIRQQEALTREIESTKQSLESLQGQYREFGSVSLQTQEASIQKLNDQLKNTKENLKSVNDALKLDPGNTDLLTQKQKLLADAVAQTKQKLTEQKAELEALKNAPQTDETIQKQDQLTREIAETTAELKNLTKEYENFGSVSAQKIAAAGEKVQQVGQKMSSVGSKMTMGITAPVVAGATAAVNAFGDVDKEFQLVKQTMGETKNSAEDFEGLWDQIGESAKASVFGMQDAADATLNYARQGFTAKEATDMLTPAMSLASGTGTDLSTVTAGLGNALKMFGADSSEAAEYADVLATAQAQANTDTTNLFEAMSVAGPICKTVGWNIKDLATITDVFGNAGISGSEGATALKTGLARLAAPASDGATAMEQLGLSTGQTYAIFNEDGSMKAMPEVLANLNSAFSGLTQEEELTAASAIFGKNQMAKWLTLIQASPEDVSGLRNALDDCSGSADNMANALMSGTGGKIEQLKSTFDVLKVTVGEAVAPAFTALMEKVTDLMNAFMELDPKTQNLIVKAVGIAAAIGPILVVVGKLATGIGAIMKLAPAITGMIGTVSKIGGVFSSLWSVLAANPIILVVAAVAGLVAAFVHLWNTSEEFRNFWIGLWDGIKSVATAAWEGISSFFTTAWNGIVDTAKAVFNGLGDFFGGIWDGISGAASAAWEGITGSLSTAWDGIAQTASTVFGGIGDFFSGVWDGISGAASTAWSEITGVLSSAWDGITQTASSVFGTIGDGIGQAWDAVSSKTSETWETIKSNTSTAWGNIKQSVERNGGEIKGVIATAVQGYKSIWQNGFDFINQATGGKLGAAMQAARGKLDAIRGVFRERMEVIKSTVKGGLDRISQFFSGCKLQLPKIKLPHFSLSGKLSLDPPSVPHISVQWYKKAYGNAMMFDSPTVLPTLDGLKGFGDGNGSELVVGTNRLMDMIANATAQDNSAQMMESFMSRMLALMNQYFPQMANQQVVLDSGTLVGSIAPQMNRQLGIIAGRKLRGGV